MLLLSAFFYQFLNLTALVINRILNLSGLETINILFIIN